MLLAQVHSWPFATGLTTQLPPTQHQVEKQAASLPDTLRVVCGIKRESHVQVFSGLSELCATERHKSEVLET